MPRLSYVCVYIFVAVTIEDGDDLLPILLDEFPHLHLSLHTWHELWRKGLNQIEQITRAHQEVKRKKSHAQGQVSQCCQLHRTQLVKKYICCTKGPIGHTKKL